MIASLAVLSLLLCMAVSGTKQTCDENCGVLSPFYMQHNLALRAPCHYAPFIRERKTVGSRFYVPYPGSRDLCGSFDDTMFCEGRMDSLMLQKELARLIDYRPREKVGLCVLKGCEDFYTTAIDDLMQIIQYRAALGNGSRVPSILPRRFDVVALKCFKDKFSPPSHSESFDELSIVLAIALGASGLMVLFTARPGRYGWLVKWLCWV
mmetsp:Transcript_23878/g.38062  ORF Transcript_23878/g.38062 Transcript_23878/m.38062 type:complete len:208 (-) Transcript_23878:38-661(-)